MNKRESDNDVRIEIRIQGQRMEVLEEWKGRTEDWIRNIDRKTVNWDNGIKIMSIALSALLLAFIGSITALVLK